MLLALAETPPCFSLFHTPSRSVVLLFPFLVALRFEVVTEKKHFLPLIKVKHIAKRSNPSSGNEQPDTLSNHATLQSSVLGHAYRMNVDAGIHVKSPGRAYVVQYVQYCMFVSQRRDRLFSCNIIIPKASKRDHLCNNAYHVQYHSIPEPICYRSSHGTPRPCAWE